MEKRITLHPSNFRKSGCAVWGVHLDGSAIGWLLKESGSTAGQGLLAGWSFEAEIANPFGPGTNVIFEPGTRANIVRKLERLAKQVEKQ